MKHKSIKDLPESILIKQGEILEHTHLESSVANDESSTVYGLENLDSFLKNFSSDLKEVKWFLGQMQYYSHNIKSYYNELEKARTDLKKRTVLLDEQYNKILQEPEIIYNLSIFLHDLGCFQYSKEQIVFSKKGINRALKSFSNELVNLENRIERCDKSIVNAIQHHNAATDKVKILEEVKTFISSIRAILIQAKFQLNVLRQSEEDIIKIENQLIKSELDIKKYCSKLLEERPSIIDLVGLMTFCSSFREVDIEELNRLKNRAKEATNDLAKEIKKIDDMVLGLEEAVKPKLPSEETWYPPPTLCQ